MRRREFETCWKDTQTACGGRRGIIKYHSAAAVHTRGGGGDRVTRQGNRFYTWKADSAKIGTLVPQ